MPSPNLANQNPTAHSASPQSVQFSASTLNQTLLLLATIALLACTLIFCLVKTELYGFWAGDPAGQTTVVPEFILTPPHMAWLNTGSVVLAGLVLLLHAWLGGKIRWGWVMLTGLGMAACAYHAHEDIENLTRGATWTAAAALGLAAGHLAQFERPRRWMTVALLSMLIPMAFQAIYDVYVANPEFVRQFEAHRNQFLQKQGMTPDSNAAQTYIRRLKSPDALGAFEFSNVLGSISAALTALAAAMAMGAFLRRNRRDGMILLVIAALGIVTVCLSRSKGAGVALALTGGLLLLALAATRRPGLRRLLPAVGVGLIVVAIAALLARGWWGRPPTINGERSLLFRYQYVEGAATIIRENPGRNLFLGVGPAGFVTRYFHAKDPFSPEDVTSTHNVFVDWVTMLGVGGMAWSMLLLLWLWNAGRRPAADIALPDPAPKASQAGQGIENGNLLPAALLTAAIFVPSIMITLPGLLPEQAVMNLVAALCFLAITAWLVGPQAFDRRWMSVGLFAAGVVLLVHNQIEMTFFQGGSVAIAWVILAVAAGGGTSAHCPSPFGRGWRVPTPGEGVANPRFAPTPGEGVGVQKIQDMPSKKMHTFLACWFSTPSPGRSAGHPLPEGEEQARPGFLSLP